MELNSSINTFTKGLNLDADLSMMPEGQYRYAENIRLLTNADGTTGVLQNIEHIRQYTNNIPTDETIIGTATTRVYDQVQKGTIECGIVLTKKTVNNNIYNTLYKVTGFKSIEIINEVITKGYLELENNVSIVTNYESDRVSNIYICDGLTPIKVINIHDDNLYNIVKNEDGTETKQIIEVSDPTRFDITPGCVLLPLEFVETIGGMLPAGSIQYCYQLFNENGPSTTTASLSELIPITNYGSGGNSQNTKGQIKGELSGKGCKLRAKFMNDGRFDRARLFSIIYLDNTTIPDIYIISEIEIPNVEEYEFITFEFNDTGASYLSKITIQEFNNLVPFEFNAKSIEKMQNRLFAANVQELTWDVKNFDTRAYRCTKDQQIVLNNSDVSKSIRGYLSNTGKIYATKSEAIDDVGTEIIVDDEHDCINPSNEQVLSSAEYSYYFNENNICERGGIGPNISYRFTYTELVPSSSESATISNDLLLDAKGTVSVIHTFYENGDLCNTEAAPQGKTIIPNYADPYVVSRYVGYQRDEIYRFGIIFYNNKNIPSPVHWIADIRMPSINETDVDLYSKIHPFHTGAFAMCYSKQCELVAYALGVEFTLKNIPADVIAYEIVRCDRNEIDRTIVSQGILGAIYKFDDWNSDKNYYNGENDLRPSPFFSLADNFKTFTLSYGDQKLTTTHSSESGYFEFVSPEIIFGKETIIDQLKKQTVQPLYKVNSATSNKVCIAQEKIYNVAEEGVVSNDDSFGTACDYPLGYLNTGYSRDTSSKGFAGVFKYYNKETCDKSTFKADDIVIGSILPYILDLPDMKPYAQPIGNKLYTNMSAAGHRQWGAHGVNAVLKTDDVFSPHVTAKTNAQFSSALICNIKKNVIPYNGNTYVARQNSIYNSCGCYVACDNSITPDYHKAVCYGGDIYLSVLDYLSTSSMQVKNDAEDFKQNNLCCVCYIPLESQANLNLRSDDCYSRTVNQMIGQNLVQNEPAVLPNGYTQKKPYYEYNPVYSAVTGSKQYVSKGIYSVDDQISQNRIVVSELKTNNELIDSWTKFKFANYLDVDSQYGQITNLKVFDNKLYFWQDSAVGIASVNERSLITDANANALVLGTGGVLARFDYLSNQNGSSIVNDKSIVTSSSSIYWYDFDKNEICSLSQSLQPLSKTKNVQSHLNSLSRKKKDNVVSFYDRKYNEVWFRIYDRSLIYNEYLQCFTSFYTHTPNWFFPFSDKLVTIKDNNLYYLHNIYDINSELKEERISKIQFIVNKDGMLTKTFDNVSFSADLLDNKNSIPNIITNVAFKTKTQQTNLENDKAFNHIEIREDNYRFAIPREQVENNAYHQLTSQSYLGRMRGKYLICDYTFDCNNNREFKLPYIKTTYRYSML